MKTSSDLTQDLATLETEQASVQALVRSIPELSKAAAHATTQNILNRCTIANVQAAQARLEDAQGALARADALTRAIAETREALTWQQGKERREFCESIDQNFKVEMERYVEQGRELLATYRRLAQLSNQYMGMTNRPLLDNFHREMNLPQLTGALGGRSNICTGMEG